MKNMGLHPMLWYFALAGLLHHFIKFLINMLFAQTNKHGLKKLKSPLSKLFSPEFA